MPTYNETRGIRLKNKSIRDTKNNEIKYKYIHKIFNMQKYIIRADVQYNTNSKYSRYDSFLSVADCVWARDVSYVTLRENLFCITKRAVHITCRRNVVWFQLCDLTDSNSKIKPVGWQQHCDGEELINYGTFLHEGVWYSCTKSACELGVSVWNAAHWKNKLGLKQRVHKCGWIDGLHVCLAGRGVASETSGEKCCLTFSTVGKVYCHFMPSGMTTAK